jgi:serpin B
MMIMMPDKVDGLAHLERSLSAEAVDKWRSHLKEKTIQIYLPRFRMTSKFELGRVLQEMGMRLPFTGKADFSGLSPRHDMVLSQVIHQAFVSVDERGTEAAAGTAAQTLLSLPREFLVDRPFVFLIRDNGTGTITFVGRVMNPLK